MELTNTIIQSYMNQEVTSPCISLYIPTHPKSTSQRINEDRIRFKNALQALENEQAFTNELASTHQQLVALTDDDEFWLHQGLSLAVFADPSGISSLRLPYELTPVSLSSYRYAVSPLLAMKNMGQTYYLLDIDLQQPRLYAGTAANLEEVHDIGMPTGIEDEIDTEQRKRTVGSRSGTGNQGAVHYGHSEVDQSKARDVSRYLRMLAEPVNTFLNDKSDPLFIVSSPKVTAEFRSLLDYSHLLPDELTANYDQNRVHDLHAAASSVIADIVQQNSSQVVQRYNDTEPSLKVDGRSAVEVAAETGRVETLLLPIVRHTTDGVRSDGTTAPLIELPEDFAAFDSVVQKVAEQSGTIVPVQQADFPDDPSMKAVLRF